MLRDRCCGLLLHPTSLPGPHGIGDLGDAAFAFVDFLAAARQTRWQVLPLSPTGYADSPYAAFSSFAGNPLLISLDRLAASGDLDPAELADPPAFPTDAVDFGAVIAWKAPRLRRAAERFLDHAAHDRRAAYDAFCAREASWLDDYAAFLAIKDAHADRARADGRGEGAWMDTWDADVARRDPDALRRWTAELARPIAVQKVVQHWFFEQWSALKAHANARRIEVIGDLPIFVALDSADVWAAPLEFRLDEARRPTHVAGVPPDYFSETGQRWGNPLYDWDRMRENGFAWWIRRFRGTRALVDWIRVDHFRGFQACWTIPAAEPTAVNGEWVEAPGAALFAAVREALGELPILAEDLGVITPEVDRLRDDNAFPGMRVLQFAFDSKESRANVFLPHRHVENCVVYTGTHDNDPVRGWYESRGEDDRAAVRDYLGYDPEDIAWALIRLAMSSVAKLVVVPMQDALSLGAEARMNTPATHGANWRWRMAADAASPALAARLAALVATYERDDPLLDLPPST